MPYIVLNNDELAHFKYIRREPDGHGSWRYFYETGRQKNITGVGKPVYKRETAPTVAPVGLRDMSNRPRRNSAGNYTTKVSNPYKPYNYESSSKRDSPGVTKDLYDHASRNRNWILKKQNSGKTLSEREKDDLQYYTKVVNGEGRNMAADKQEADRQRKAEAEAKKPINVAKSAVNSISTAVGSAFDKGKNWLSGIFTTKVTITPANPIQPKTGGIFSTKKTIKIL